MRNDWKGHGGAIGADRARRLHDDALATLAELRGVIAPAFRTLKLVRTGRAEILSGLYRYEADLLQGSNQTFLPTHVELEESIESKVLALVGSDRRALRLLPFVRMGMPKRDENACYFYSRRERSTARYVSYHQEAEAIDLSDAPLDFLERWNQPPPQPDFT
jgi:hypothetical protein